MLVVVSDPILPYGGLWWAGFEGVGPSRHLIRVDCNCITNIFRVTFLKQDI